MAASHFLDDCTYVRSDYRCRIFSQFFIYILSWQRAIKSISTIIRSFDLLSAYQYVYDWFLEVTEPAIF